MFKRVSSVVMVIAMMLTMLCTFCVASAAAPMSITVAVDAADGQYARGDFVEVTVGVKDYTKVCLMAFGYTVDEDVLQLLLEDGVAAEDYTYIASKFGAPAAVNPTVKYVNWSFASNKVVRDPNRNEMSEFDLITLVFEIPEDAPYGESTISVAFAQKDTNGGKSIATSPSAGVVNELVPGTDYAVEAATVTINIACPNADEHDALEWVSDDNGNHVKECPTCDYLVEEGCDLGEPVVEPETCDQDGTSTRTCSKCGYEEVTPIDEIDGHDWQPDGLDAKENGKHICSNDGCGEEEACYFVYIESQPGDCVNDATETYDCFVCGYTYTKIETAPGHELVPFPSEPGHHYCANCTEVYEACVYDIDVSSSGATCQKPGETVKACVCGDTKTTTSTLEHSFGEYTSNEDGTHSATCTTCNPAEGEVAVDVKNCDYEALDASDCENDGTKKCKECGYVTVNEEDLSAGHDWSDWEHVEDTDTHTRTCGNANCPIGTETADCAGDEEYFDPSCDEFGYTEMICEDCGEVYTDIDFSEDGQPTGHAFDEVVHEVVAGVDCHSSTGECLNGCGTKLEQEPCDFEYEYTNCQEDGTKTCVVCGFSDIAPAAGDHVELVTVYVPTTPDHKGGFYDTCVDCGEVDYICYETEAVEPFKDIAADQIGEIWYAGAANFCYTYGGLMSGEYGNFNATGLVTRGQVVTVLGRLWLAQYGQYLIEDAEGMYSVDDAMFKALSDEEFEALLADVADEYHVTPVTMSDLNGTTYYDRYALLLANMGVAKGRDDGTFDGNATVTRAELATFLVRYLDANGWNYDFAEAGSTFADIDSCGWAKETVEYAGELGLFAGDDNGNFNPWATANRAQLATLMERIVRATEWFEIVSPDFFD